MSFDPEKFRVKIGVTRKQNVKELNTKHKQHKKSLKEKIPIHLDSILLMGKYKGKTAREILSIDPQYISWFNKNTKYYICYSKK